MREFAITDAADQQFGAYINNRRVTIRLRYNVTSERWSFDMSVDDLPILHGRRIVTGVDLLRQYRLGLGAIFALGDNPALPADRQTLVNGTVKLYQISDDERAAVMDATVS